MVPNPELSHDAAMLIVVILAVGFYVWQTWWKPPHGHNATQDNMGAETNPPVVRGLPSRPTVDPDDMDFEMWQAVW